MRKKILRISLALGILLFFLFIYLTGPSQIWENIKKLKWQHFLFLLFLRFIHSLLRTVSWKIIFEKYEQKASFLYLYKARLAGDAIGYLTPSAQLGGEPIRAIMGNESHFEKSFASVIVDKTVEIINQIFFTIIGIIMAITMIPLPGKYEYIFVAFVFGAAFFAILAFIKQKQGFFIWIIKILKKLKIQFKFIEKREEKIREVDDHISNFYKNHSKTFMSVFILNSFIFLLWITEIYVTMLFIGTEGVTFIKSYLIVSLGAFMLLLPTMPASLGTYEVTYLSIFVLLNLGADKGMTLILIRRVILLLWSGIGLLLLFNRQRSGKK
jgi:uncharacterized protein (TIRG00374 family)